MRYGFDTGLYKVICEKVEKFSSPFNEMKNEFSFSAILNLTTRSSLLIPDTSLMVQAITIVGPLERVSTQKFKLIRLPQLINCNAFMSQN